MEYIIIIIIILCTQARLAARVAARLSNLRAGQQTHNNKLKNKNIEDNINPEDKYNHVKAHHANNVEIGLA